MAPLTKDDLTAQERQLVAAYATHQQSGLTLDLTRGKPSPEQLALSDGMEDMLNEGFVSADGTDTRNYGGLEGLREARQLGADLLGVHEDEVLAGGNTSLTLMYQYLASALHHGPLGQDDAWNTASDPLKFLCIVPGYDRHFTVTSDLGFEAVNVDMRPDGPDMDEVERLVTTDPMIKGIWCVPKYQNPTGHTFSEAVVRRFSRLPEMAGPGFRIIWDNAYAVHDLYDDSIELTNVMDRCREAKTTDGVIIFGSTSKITRAGSGVSFVAASPPNLAQFKKHLGAQTIGPDKVNQLKHVRFLRDLDGIKAHMRRHASIARPKFELVLRHLNADLKGIATWTRPRGGYFISIDVPRGTAREAVRLAGDAGVKITPAGATYPHGRDPHDANIRLAPTYPSLEEVDRAMPVFTTAVKLATIRSRLAQGSDAQQAAVSIRS